MTGRGQANALTRATAVLAALFFLTSLVADRSWRATAARRARSSTGVDAARAGRPASSGRAGGPNILEQLQRHAGRPAGGSVPGAAPAPAAPRSRSRRPPAADAAGSAASSGDQSALTEGRQSGPLSLWMAEGRSVRACESARPPLWIEAHGAVRFHHRRRGLLARQGPRLRGPRRAAAGARLQGPPAQARPLSQRRSGHDEPLPARRGLRHRRRGRDRPRPRPLRALHRACRRPRPTTSPPAGSISTSSPRSGAATISARPSR